MQNDASLAVGTRYCSDRHGGPASVSGRTPSNSNRGDIRRFGNIEFSESTRAAAVAKAQERTRSQAERLGTTPEVILEAVRRGWMPELLEKVTSRYALESLPPPSEAVPTWVDMAI